MTKNSGTYANIQLLRMCGIGIQAIHGGFTVMQLDLWCGGRLPWRRLLKAQQRHRPSSVHDGGPVSLGMPFMLCVPRRAAFQLAVIECGNTVGEAGRED